LIHIRGFLAVVHGARTWGRVLIEFTEDEILELDRRRREPT
jgi:hypothetical protein